MGPGARSLLIGALMTGGSSLALGPPLSTDEPPSMNLTLFRELAQRENPSVVSITARTGPRFVTEGEAGLFRLFGALPPGQHEIAGRRSGSGFVIDAAGGILTNSHVIDEADSIDVYLFGEERKPYRAVRVGVDPLTDTALLRLQNPPAGLRPVTLGDSSALRPGDWVMVIGNPFALDHTVSVGVVGFPRRPVTNSDGSWQDMIQIDASINPGSSGGPVVNAQGDVVGMTVSRVAGERGTAGIGFALPINTVKSLLPQLGQGRVGRAQLGVELHAGPMLNDEASALGLPVPQGALVKMVDVDSPAERAGLRAGDVILKIDERPVAESRDLIAQISSMRPGTRITVTIFRQGREYVRPVVLDDLTTVLGEPIDRGPAGQRDQRDGLTFRDITPALAKNLSLPDGSAGALITAVIANSAADDAELTVDDVVRAINGRAVRNSSDARRSLQTIAPGQPIFLSIWRDGSEMFLQMRLP